MNAASGPVWDQRFEQWTRVFSIIMVVDRDLRLLRCSDVLRRHLPQAATAPLLLDIFRFKRPRSVGRFDQLLERLDGMFLMESTDGSFAVRGQMLQWVPDEPLLVFVGSPWLAWLMARRPDLKLGSADFTPHDAQVDQVFYMSTERRMVEDLERLTTQLQAAKASLEAATQAKSVFFAQMSHEMRTPLNGIVSALALLGEHPVPEPARRLLQLAKLSSDNLMQVVNYVLDVAKIESAEGRPQQVAFDMPELIASVIDTVRARAMQKGLNLESRIDGRLSSAYRGDSARLRQSLLNLLGNAINFTETGTVVVSAQPAPSEGQSLRIEVSDTGPGIDPAEQQRIFEPFVSVDRPGRPRQQPGTGLGLDIVRRNVELMGGKVGVHSTPGAGSTFWIELPIEAIWGVAQLLPSSGSLSAALSDAFSGRVLLVDDNSTNLMLGTMILERMGLEVIQAASGEQAVALASRRDIDLILMDISMPGIDGFEACRQIRQFRDARSLPILALTAYASSVEQGKAVQAGMNGYLTKPVSRELLGKALAGWLPVQSAVVTAIAGPPVVDVPQVDIEMVQQLMQGIGRDNLMRLIDNFLMEARRRWAQLESANLPADRAHQAHSLAGTCRNFGLPGVADQLAGIERHAMGLDRDPPPPVEDVGRQLHEGLRQLQALVQQL
ncbi:MAG: ATP-binding protein [Xanthomonadales bacterium]|jgi:signal transduction histidine kinase/ActR/RegA family two-component response regulator|nr:ATP-binding protein [Xanthomonadales bacterium]